ncbi:hypothetical protein [Streptomyces kanasensis]|uniref:hypothetical protein n=1 Tax=Streptomyces kanasensis TaxID=936756 RepID=UPI003819BBF5
MNTWNERLSGASVCEPRRPFDAAAGLRRLAKDARHVRPARTEPPADARARHQLEVLTTWGVTQAGAATHVKKFTDILDSAPTDFDGWIDSIDIDGVHVFACFLHLDGHPESARFWWQLAAGADHSGSAYCLYLHHLSRGEVDEAALWRMQTAELIEARSQPEELIAMVDFFAQYQARTHCTFAAGLEAEIERWADRHDDDGGLVCRPHPRLVARLDELAGRR